jgi:hypothetical protein
MKIKQSNPFGELTPDRLDRFEREHALHLPEDYRQFLLEHNGGIPTPEDTIDFEGGSSDIKCFYGISDGENEASLERNLKDIKEWGIDEGLPIGHDFFGNFYLLSVQSEREGQIFFWDHDLGDMLFVAASFTEFTEKLCERKYFDDFQVPDKPEVPDEPEIPDEFKIPDEFQAPGGFDTPCSFEDSGELEEPGEFEEPDSY